MWILLLANMLYRLCTTDSLRSISGATPADSLMVYSRLSSAVDNSPVNLVMKFTENTSTTQSMMLEVMIVWVQFGYFSAQAHYVCGVGWGGGVKWMVI